MDDSLIQEYQNESHSYASNTTIEPELIYWIRDRISISDFNLADWADKDNLVIADFLSSKIHLILFIYYYKHNLYVTTSVPNLSSLSFISPSSDSIEKSKNSISQIQIFVKIQQDTIFTLDKMKRDIHFVTLRGHPLDSLLTLMNKVYLPSFLHNTTWPDSLRKDFTGQLHKFMAYLTDTVNQSKGHTVLYLPHEDLSNPHSCVNDKELVQRLEETLLHWTNQIKDVVSGQEHNQADTSGPLEEIHFWNSRCLDLQNIQKQLQQTEVKEIVNVLTMVKSSFLQPYWNFFEMIEKGSSEALDNLHFLKKLENPCERLNLATSSQIPSILPDILHTIQIIWEKSNYYSHNEPLTGLLRKVSNQIIKQCSSQIDLSSIFIGIVDIPMNSLLESIQCGVKWKEIFHQTAENINKQYKHGWNFEESSIFAQIDAFVQRCRDLLEICEGHIQFISVQRPYNRILSSSDEHKNDHYNMDIRTFSGIHGPLLERSLKDIEEAFLKLINKLQDLPYEILDITATQWHDHYNEYSRGIKDLEVMVTNVINSAFECCSDVVDGVNLLLTFHHFTKRPNLRSTIEKKTSDVYQMFIKDIKNVKAHFDRHKNHPRINNTQPLISGSAIWAKGLYNRLHKQYERLMNIQIYLTPVRDKSECEHSFNQISILLRDYISKCNEKWLTNLRENDSNISSLLQQTLLTINSNGHIVSNFDKSLLRLFEEVRCWEKFKDELNFTIPPQIYEILDKKNDLRIIREKIMNVCHIYNSIITCLSSKEEKGYNEKILFQVHLNHLENILRPGIESLNWSSDDIFNFIETCTSKCQEVLSIVNHYRSLGEKVKFLCHNIMHTSFIDFAKNQVFEIQRFQHLQDEHLSQISSELMVSFHNIEQSMNQMYRFFVDGPIEVQREWLRYVLKVDEDIENSLIFSVKRSISEISCFILPGRMEIAIFKIFVMMDTVKPRGGIIFNPSLTQLSEIIVQCLKNIVKLFKLFPRLCSTLSSKDHYTIEDEKQRIIQQQKPLDRSQTLLKSQSINSILHLMEKSQIPLYEKLYSVNHDTISEIGNHIFNVEQDLKDLLKGWNEDLENVWQNDWEAYLRRFDPNQDWEVVAYTARINDKKRVQTNIERKEISYNVKFLKIDFSELKKTLLSYCDHWYNLLTGLLHDKAKRELSDLSNTFKTNIELLQKVPNTIDQLDRNIKLFEKLSKELPELHDRIEPLGIMHKALEEYDVDVKEEKREKEQLLDEFGELQTTLDNAKHILDQRKQKMQKELELDMNFFNHLVIEIRQEFLSSGPFDDQSHMTEPDCEGAFRYINEFSRRIKDMKQKAVDMKIGLTIFDIEIPRYKELDDTEKDLEQLHEVWSIMRDWLTEWNKWRQKSLKSLYLEELSELENTAINFQNVIQQIGRTTKEMKVWQTLKERVEKFRNTMPLIKNLKDRALRDRHWVALRHDIGHIFEPGSEILTLDKLFQMNIYQHAELINSLCKTARDQLVIEEDLESIAYIWSNLQFDIKQEVFSENGVEKVKNIIGSLDHVFENLEKHQMKLSNMKNSVFYGDFQDDINSKVTKLNEIERCLELIHIVQTQLDYLEGIFGIDEEKEVGDDLRNQMKVESSHFFEVHSSWIEITNEFVLKKNMESCLTTSVYNKLKHMDSLLSIVQKSLQEYLETKRMDFPRLYFLSNNDLLEILGHNKDPFQVQKHIKNCFIGIHHLDFVYNTARSWEAKGMYDDNGEYVAFLYPVSCNGPVEKWLKKIETCTKDTLRKLLQTSYKKIEMRTNKDQIKTYELKNRKWVESTIGQLVLLSASIVWTDDCKIAIGNVKKKRPLKSLAKRWNKYLISLIEMINSDLTDVDRLKLTTLITMELHNRDVIDSLHKSESHWAEQKNGLDSWEWKSQLRFEYNQGQITDGDWGHTILHQGNNSYDYGYEYQGNNGRLVMTSLTERCFLTLTNALYYHKGCNLLGPTSTGKTETIKDLGKVMGKYVMVFNCSDQLDYHSLGRLLSGIAQTGCWGCFDEFNRISSEVLSVVSLQIYSILTSISIQQDNNLFIFEGKDIPLDKTCGIFITTNISFIQNNSRRELPESLKTQFRPISMIVPDYNLIIEYILFSEGFEGSNTFSRKITALYHLMQQYFGVQDRYDFSLRNIKNVLKMAGYLHRQYPKMKEEDVIILSLKDINTPKFSDEDINLFNNLLVELFTTFDVLALENKLPIQSLASECLKKKHFQNIPVVINKITHLYDIMQIRHGNILIGSSNTGKTTCWQTLRDSINILFEEKKCTYNVEDHILNPKSLEIEELFGHYDLSSREWYPGILSSLIKKICTDENKNDKWLVLDGPIDSYWIESMNTVLDDSKVLTLVNGDRIIIPPNVHILFEVDDLVHSSPSTISRCGMINFNKTDLDFQHYLSCWTLSKNFPKNVNTVLSNIFQNIVVKLLHFKSQKCHELFPTDHFHNIVNLCKLFESFYYSPHHSGIDPNDTQNFINMVKMTFFFCCVWTIGGTIDEPSRELFNEYFRSLDVPFPPLNSVYDYYVDKIKKDWSLWEGTELKQITPPKDSIVQHFFVDTSDTIRYKYILDRLIDNQINCIIVGKTGVGKTSFINMFLQKYHNYTITITFSRFFKSKDTQYLIERQLERRQRNNYGPKGGKSRLIVFIDEISMPKPDISSQPPLEFIRHWLSYQSWYSRLNIAESGFSNRQGIKYIQDTQLIASMGAAEGAKNPISKRLLTKLNVIYYSIPDETQLQHIFTTLLNEKFTQFDEEIKPLGNLLSLASIDFYSRISQQILPTPEKSHYVFNLRDLVKVIQGVYRSDKTNYDSRDLVIRLWIHEITRVFHDRLVDNNDRTQFRDILLGVCNTFFKDTLDSMLKDQLCVFTHFVTEKERVDSKQCLFLEVPNRALLKKTVEEKLNQMPDSQPLVLFDEALLHICRLTRVLSLPQGHMLLVGHGGTGRHSLLKLACFICGFEFSQLHFSNNYSQKNFYEEMRKLYFQTGYQDKKTVLCISDTELSDIFFEDINNMLINMNITSLFLPGTEHYETLMNQLHVLTTASQNPHHQQHQHHDSHNLFSHFLNRVQNNLHLIIFMSPGERFRYLCRIYPSLINNTQIEWYSDWPEAALKEVALSCLHDMDISNEESRDGLTDVFTNIHHDVLKVCQQYKIEYHQNIYISPIHYIELVNSYRQIVDQKRKKTGYQRDILRQGLNKLDGSKKQVSDMRIELDIRKKKVNQKRFDCNKLMQENIRKRHIAEESRTHVAQEKERIANEEIECKEIEKKCQESLNKELPKLQNALKAVEQLDPGALVEVRSYVFIPPMIEKIMHCVMYLFGEDPSPSNIKVQLSNPNFFNRIKNFKPDNISNPTLNQLSRITRNKDFNPETVREKSSAGAAICEWVLAIEAYAKVLKDISPLRLQLQEAKSSLKNKSTQLKIAEENLEQVTNLVKMNQEAFTRSEEEKNQLSTESDLLEVKLERASCLVDSLSSERTRWENCINTLDIHLSYLLGDACLASAFLSYAGPFCSEYRQKLIDTWVKAIKSNSINFSPKFSFSKFLVEDITISRWNIQSLPSDEFSIQNAVLITHCHRFPLILDPQGQAVKWISKKDGDHLKFISHFHDEKEIIDTLTSASSYGFSVIVEIRENIESILLPFLLARNISSSNQSKSKTSSDDQSLSLHPNFFLYLVTLMKKPNLSTEIFTKTTVINFEVMHKGLEEQLMSILVYQEQPELETQKKNLVLELIQNKQTITDLENKILEQLSVSGTNSLFDDENIINLLQSSKNSSEKAKESLKGHEETEKEIEKVRENYRFSASFASLLFFVLDSLSHIEYVYYFCLDSYIDLFLRSIEFSRDPKLQSESDRLVNLNRYHMESVYKYACKGIFEKHKLLLSFLMTIRKLQYEKKLNNNEYQFFLRGSVVNSFEEIKNPCEDWLPDNSWIHITELEKLPAFKNICNSLENNSSIWKKWYLSLDEVPEKIQFPGDWNNKFDSFQRMILLRCLRPDRLLFSIRSFVSHHLGPQFIMPPEFDLSFIFSLSSCSTPIFFILSPSMNVNPWDSLYNFSLKMQIPITQLTLGQGQESNLKNLLLKSVSEGRWLFLANCHYMTNSLSDLDFLLSSLKPIHPQFRLWLSSYPHSNIPLSLLRRSIKVTVEPPSGIRNNMIRLYNLISEDLFNKRITELGSKSSEYKKLLFCLAFFHSILLERRKFNTIGWNNQYYFNDDDFLFCENILNQYLINFSNNDSNLDYLRHLVCEVVYGGRVTDERDKRLLRVYSSQFISEQCLIIPNFKLTSSLSESYFIPNDGIRSSYLNHIRSFPMFDDGEVFGLHINADIINQQDSSYELLDTLLSLEPSETGLFEGELKSNMLNIIKDILTKIPTPFDYHNVVKKCETDKHQRSGVKYVLLHEISQYNILIQTVISSLTQLNQSLKGHLIMSPQLEEVYNSLNIGSVPTSWHIIYPSSKPLNSWINDLILRIEMFKKWVDEGPPIVTWLGGFSCPNIFLTSLLQLFFKQNNTSIDNVSWEFSIINLDEIDEPPLNGAYIKGLYLEGAKWDMDTGCVSDSSPMEMVFPMPVVHFKPIISKSKKKSKGFCSSPLYYSPLRERKDVLPFRFQHYIMNIELKANPGKDNSNIDDYWVKRGAVLLLSTSS